ncbi:hypothetical protein D3C80_2065140 [compost metagenome]
MTNWPAAATDRPRSRANAGSRPRIRNSVVSTAKPPIASSVMGNPTRVAAGAEACPASTEVGMVKQS